MPLRDMVLAALTSMVWGFAFIATRLALDSFSAPQLTALRFLIACLPVLFVPRPNIAWPSLVLIGLILFAGQFLPLFLAFGAGMPPGLASVSQQMQAFFTVIVAALFLRDVPSARQCLGMVVAFAGLALIGLTIGGDLPPLALGLALAGALSWAIGNVLVKRHAAVPIFPLVVWCSLVPPLPSLLLSLLTDGQSLIAALAHASWLSLAAALGTGEDASDVSTTKDTKGTKKLFRARSAQGALPLRDLGVLRGSNFLVSTASAAEPVYRRDAQPLPKSIENALKWIFRLTSLFQIGQNLVCALDRNISIWLPEPDCATLRGVRTGRIPGVRILLSGESVRLPHYRPPVFRLYLTGAGDALLPPMRKSAIVAARTRG
jgi:O-acetylserine/cysteine efflux transporter